MSVADGGEAWAGGGPEGARVVELLLDCDGGVRRASGYVIGPGLVLTAAHAVRRADRVIVRGNGRQPDEWTADALDVLISGQDEIAVVRILPDSLPDVPRAEFGRLSDRAAVVRCQAVGHPRWKLRTDDDSSNATGSERGRFRDRAHAVGYIALLANVKEGTLEIVTEPPERDEDPARSPWEGMSGAAVWVGNRIVGIISKHRRSESPSRLTAERLDRWLSGTTSRTEAGIRLRDLLQLPEDPADLPDVVPTAPIEAFRGGYLDQVRDILPIGGLLDRKDEIAAVVAFCAVTSRTRGGRPARGPANPPSPLG